MFSICADDILFSDKDISDEKGILIKKGIGYPLVETENVELPEPPEGQIRLTFRTERDEEVLDIITDIEEDRDIDIGEDENE